jgi:hypothetical protein
MWKGEKKKGGKKKKIYIASYSLLSFIVFDTSNALKDQMKRILFHLLLIPLLTIVAYTFVFVLQFD